jgi:glutamyl-tRNA reductase
MEKQNIAIIGLGRVGSIFLEKMLLLQNNGINIVGVAEHQETPGKQLAKQANIRIVTLEEMVALSDHLEIIFDLTGSEKTRQTLRTQLVARGNHYTIIAPENIARLVWNIMGNTMPLPDLHQRKGY